MFSGGLLVGVGTGPALPGLSAGVGPGRVVDQVFGGGRRCVTRCGGQAASWGLVFLLPGYVTRAVSPMGGTHAD